MRSVFSRCPRHRECRASLASVLRDSEQVQVHLPHEHRGFVSPPPALLWSPRGKSTSQLFAMQESLVLTSSETLLPGEECRPGDSMCDFLRMLVTFPLRNCLVPKGMQKILVETIHLVCEAAIVACRSRT